MSRLRRGLDRIVVVVLLIVMALTLVAFAYQKMNSIVSSSTSQPSIYFSNSYIRINPATGGGTVFINIVNRGAGALEVQYISLSTDVSGVAGTYRVQFVYYQQYNDGKPFVDDYGPYRAVSTTVSGSQNMGFNHVTSGGAGLATMVIPPGSEFAILLIFDGTPSSSLARMFSTGATYNGFIHPLSGPDLSVEITA